MIRITVKHLRYAKEVSDTFNKMGSQVRYDFERNQHSQKVIFCPSRMLF